MAGITLQQFHAMSNGKYNAGDLIIKKDGTLGITNNHVHRVGLNNKVINSDDIIAIKDQFITALEGNVSKEALNDIRKELGIPANSLLQQYVEVPRSERTFKPLTRAQVRDLIDRYVNGSDNKNNGDGEDIALNLKSRYEGVSDEVKGKFLKVGEQVNATNQAKRIEAAIKFADETLKSSSPTIGNQIALHVKAALIYMVVRYGADLSTQDLLERASNLAKELEDVRNGGRKESLDYMQIKSFIRGGKNKDLHSVMQFIMEKNIKHSEELFKYYDANIKKVENK